jgi:hypothetical protein
MHSISNPKTPRAILRGRAAEGYWALAQLGLMMRWDTVQRVSRTASCCEPNTFSVKMDESIETSAIVTRQ